MLALTWQPYFSPLPILGGALLLAALAAVAYARTMRDRPGLSLSLLAMRLALIAILALLLMGPSIVPETGEELGRPTLTIAVDTSASMQVDDMDGRSRWDFVREQWLTDTRLNRLAADYELELVGFDTAPRPLGRAALSLPADRAATGSASHIIQSLNQIVAGLDAEDASLLVFSDGRDTHDAPAAPLAQLARARAIPIHTVPVGGPNLQRDVALVAIPQQAYLLAGEQGTIRARLYQTNAAHTRTNIHLRGPGDAQSQAIAFDDSPTLEIDLPITADEPGLYEYEIEVDPVEGEIETRNNRQRVFVEVTDARLQVLILEGQPYWDTRYIAQALRADERVALTQITQLAIGQQKRIVTRAETDRELPTTLEELARYDVIILGKGLEHLLDPEQAALLPRYVADRGGQVVFARGRAYDSSTSGGRAVGRELAVLEPVVFGQGRLRDKRVVLTSAGRSHATFATLDPGPDVELGRLISDLPALAALPQVSRIKTAARVLAHARPEAVLTAGDEGGNPGRGVEQPAIVTMPYGRGQVLAIVGEGLWRWYLHERQEADAAQGLYDRFWSNTVRHLAMGSDFQPGRELTLRVSSPAVHVGEPITLTVSARQAIDPAIDARLTLTGPDGDTIELSLRTGPGSARQQHSFSPETPGPWQAVADAGGLTPEPVEARFTAYELDIERLDSAANPALLHTLATGSGGRLLDPDEPDALTDVLAAHRAAMAVPPTPEHVWNQGWVLALVLLWAGGEWLARKRGGLL